MLLILFGVSALRSSSMFCSLMDFSQFQQAGKDILCLLIICSVRRLFTKSISVCSIFAGMSPPGALPPVAPAFPASPAGGSSYPLLLCGPFCQFFRQLPPGLPAVLQLLDLLVQLLLQLAQALLSLALPLPFEGMALAIMSISISKWSLSIRPGC